MVNGNCAVVGCTNSRYKLKGWESKACDTHEGILHKDCPCQAPFRLFTFPSFKLNLEKRNHWIKLINRTTKRKGAWAPGQSDMVCSVHFVNGEPTLANPNPTLALGYEKNAKKSRRELVYSSSSTHCDSEQKNTHTDSVALPCPAKESDQAAYPAIDVLDAELPVECKSCDKKDDELKSLQQQHKILRDATTVLRKQAHLKSSQRHIMQPFSSERIKTDAQMCFYTGLQTVAIFNALFDLLKPYIPQLVYWRGLRATTKARTAKFSRVKKLTGKQQLLLVLMKLRLALLNQDLADRFDVSQATVSNLFATWVRFLSKVLGTALLVWLPKGAILSNLPDVFQHRHKATRCIIDCTEVYIERSKSIFVQAASWSDYKKHNTIKFLVGIAPSGYITFLSDCYGGRASDRFICQNSGFYDNPEYGDEIMADRGFQIKEDLLHFFCSLSIPPGARLKSQMTKKECEQTKEVANLRIHIEQAINRIKTFRILKNVMPLTLLPFADDIVRTCAAICNLKPPLIRCDGKDNDEVEE